MPSMASVSFAHAGHSRYVDLTVDDDGSYPIPRRQCGGSKLVNDLGVIELSSDDSGIEDSKLISNAASPEKIFGGHSQQEAYYLSDEDDILIIPSDIKQSTSSSSARTVSRRLQKSRVRESDGLFRSLARISDDEVALWQEHQKASLANDERLARQLAEKYDAELADMIVNPEDERLARSLAKQEEERFDQLIKSIDAKKEGIVFSVAVDAVSETLEDGSPAHCDDLERFRPWKQLFERSGMKVKKFHWFVNYELEKRFEQAREKLQRIMGEPPRELQLFHGTSSANVNSILQGGFRIGGVNGQHVVNGAAMGCGIYLAADATTSFSYTMGDNKMFACRVVPGRTSYQINPKPPRSIEVGTESFECYTNGNGVYVHRYSSLVLPCYMIEFQMPYGWGGAVNMRAVLARPMPLGKLGQAAPPFPGVVPPPRRTRKRTKLQVDAEDAALSSAPRKKRRKGQVHRTNEDENRQAGPSTL